VSIAILESWHYVIANVSDIATKDALAPLNTAIWFSHKSLSTQILLFFAMWPMLLYVLCKIKQKTHQLLKIVAQISDFNFQFEAIDMKICCSKYNLIHVF
jgi:hypothetical protein